MTPPTGKIETLAEVAERTRKSPSTLRYWRHRGVGPRSFKLGRSVMYREADVNAWLDAQYASATGDATPAR